MSVNKFNEKPNYPFTYGDVETENDYRLSDYVVNKLKDKRTRKYLGALAAAVYALGSQAAPVGAIPPEYGEAAANAAQDMPQCIPPLGEVAGNVNPQGGVPNNGGPFKPHGPVHLNLKGPNQNRYEYQHIPGTAKQLQAWRLPGPPTTAIGQYTNTIMLAGSVAWICLNAFWGSPVFAYGCVGIVGGILNEVRKKCL